MILNSSSFVPYFARKRLRSASSNLLGSIFSNGTPLATSTGATLTIATTIGHPISKIDSFLTLLTEIKFYLSLGVLGFWGFV